MSAFLLSFRYTQPSNDGLQLRRAISIRAEGKRLLEKHAIAPSAARLCYVAAAAKDRSADSTAVRNFGSAGSKCSWLNMFPAKELCFVAPKSSSPSARRSNSQSLYRTVTRLPAPPKINSKPPLYDSGANSRCSTSGRPSSARNANSFCVASLKIVYRDRSHRMRGHITMAFSCGARSAFRVKERSYLRNMLSRRQLQGFVGLRR